MKFLHILKFKKKEDFHAHWIGGENSILSNNSVEWQAKYIEFVYNYKSVNTVLYKELQDFYIQKMFKRLEKNNNQIISITIVQFTIVLFVLCTIIYFYNLRIY